jgi:hemoglobin/transferrin/lactoferrin receptor protein
MSLRPPFARRPWLALLLLSPSLALAAEKTPTQFDTVTVTATRNEQTLAEVPSTVSVITERDIDQQNVMDIQQLVRYEPGVSVGGTGSRFGLSGFTIRGLGGNRVLTQVDGVSAPNAFAFGQFLGAQRNYVDLDAMKSVEIIRGPASSLYGSDAIGGAVSFLTKDAADYLEAGDDLFARLKTGYDGSDDTWLKSGTFAGRQGQFDGLLNLSQRTGQAVDSDGNVGGIGVNRTKANPLDYTADNLLAKVGWDYAEGQRLQLTYDHYQDETKTDVLSEYSTSAAIRTSDAKDNIDRERFTLDHSLQLDSLLADQVKTQLTHQDSETRQQTYQNRVVAGGARYRTRDSHYNEKLWNGNVQLDKHIVSGDIAQQLTYGIDIKKLENSDLREGGETRLSTGVTTQVKPTSDFPDPTSWNYAAFAQDSIEIGRWTLLPGLRYDHYEMTPHVTQDYLNSAATNPNPPTYSDSAWSPKFGATYQLTDELSLYGQYAAGFRAPQAVEIFGEFVNPGMYRTLANPDLKSETSNSFEVGLRGQNDYGSLGVALFYNRYKDFIEQETRTSSDPVSYPFGDFQYVNLDKVTIRGAETKGELFLDQFGLPSGSHLTGSVAYAYGKDEETGQPINSIDPLKGVFGIGYSAPNGRFGSELTWTIVDNKDRIDRTATPNRYATPGYGTLDLSGWLQVTQQVSVNAGLYNLTDKQYWQWNGGDLGTLNAGSPSIDRFSQPGRYAAANLIWEI